MQWHSSQILINKHAEKKEMKDHSCLFWRLMFRRCFAPFIISFEFKITKRA